MPGLILLCNRMFPAVSATYTSEVVLETFGNYLTILPHWRSGRSSGSVEVTETFVSLKHCGWLGTVLMPHLVLVDNSVMLLPASKQPIARWLWWDIIWASLDPCRNVWFNIMRRFQNRLSETFPAICDMRPSQSKFNEIIWVFYHFQDHAPWQGIVQRVACSNVLGVSDTNLVYPFA